MKIRKKASGIAIESISRLADMKYEPANGELNNSQAPGERPEGI